MKRVLLLLVMVLCASAANAAWRPVVGVGGLVDFPAQGEIRKLRYLNLAPRMSLGTQFELGARSGRHELYLAYHSSTSPVRTSEEYFVYRSSDDAFVNGWTMRQESRADRYLLAGYRRWLGAGGARISPMIGAALGTGETRLRKFHQSRFVEYDDETFDPIRLLEESRYGRTIQSKVSIGGALETGAALRLYKGFEALALLQLHFYGANVSQVHWLEDTDLYNLSAPDFFLIPSAQLQIRYMLDWGF